jgi:hypothetical protein
MRPAPQKSTRPDPKPGPASTEENGPVVPIGRGEVEGPGPAGLADGGFGGWFTARVTFSRMEKVSLFHSTVYLGLLISAFLLGGPQPITFVLGLTHGLIWIGMSVTSIFAVRFGVIDLKLAVAITLLGCVAPFFGSIEFVRQSRTRTAEAT